MVSYQAIIFDLDGTAVPSRIDGMPSKQLCSAIAANDFLRFCAATGRSWQHAQAPIQALQLQDPCVISGGTQIIDPRSQKILWEVIIPSKSVAAIRGIANKYSKNVAYVAGLDVTEPMSAKATIPEEPINTTYMFNILPEELDEVVAALHAIGDVHAALTRSWFTPGVTDLHITHKEATKEHAITELCSMLAVPKEHAVGVGDGHNDVHLFNAVGTKVAMGNAEPELKLQADIVIASIDDDGLATFITSLTQEQHA